MKNTEIQRFLLKKISPILEEIAQEISIEIAQKDIEFIEMVADLVSVNRKLILAISDKNSSIESCNNIARDLRDKTLRVDDELYNIRERYGRVISLKERMENE